MYINRNIIHSIEFLYISLQQAKQTSSRKVRISPQCNVYYCPYLLPSFMTSASFRRNSRHVCLQFAIKRYKMFSYSSNSYKSTVDWKRKKFLSTQLGSFIDNLYSTFLLIKTNTWWDKRENSHHLDLMKSR